MSVPKPQEGEKLGLTVQQQNKCVVVTRILSGGLVDQVGDLICMVVHLVLNNLLLPLKKELPFSISSLMWRNT